MPGTLLRAALAALLLTGCGSAERTAPVVEDDGPATGPSDPASGPADPADDPAGAWVLTDSNPTIEVPEGARVTLQVIADGDGWQVGGTSACNEYGGRVVTDGSSWRGEGYGGTAMGCEEPRMVAEQAYLDALQAVDTWTRPAAGVLVLSGADVELRFEALPAVPTAELMDTTWVLEGLIGGVGADASVSSHVAGAQEATLRLDSDGTMDASTGCRTFSGEWTETGDEILLTTFGQRDDSPNVAADGTTTCDETLVGQESHVLSVLGDGFRVEVDGRRATLVSRDGLGLTYRVAETG